MIDPVTKGSTPTLLDAEKANEVITAINLLLKTKIQRGHQDQFHLASDGATITLADRADMMLGIEMYICGIYNWQKYQ